MNSQCRACTRGPVAVEPMDSRGGSGTGTLAFQLQEDTGTLPPAVVEPTT